MAMSYPADTLHSLKFGGYNHRAMSGFFAVFAVCLGAVSGLLISVGSPILSIAVVGGVLSLFLFATPIMPLTGLLVVLTFVVQGLLVYFGKVSQAAWLPYFICLLMAFKLLPALFGIRDEGFQIPRFSWYSLIITALAIHVALLLYSTVLNRPQLLMAVGGLKNYLPFWVVTLLLLTVPAEKVRLAGMWKLLTVIYFIQIPLIVYQFFVIMPQRWDARFGSASADAIVGSFGGNMESGGKSASLVVFCMVIIVYWLAKWRNKQASFLTMAPIFLLGLMLFMAGEVKGLLVWIPLSFLYLYRSELLRKPARTLGLLVFLSAVLAATFFAYRTLHWNKGHQTSVEGQIAEMAYFFDTGNVNFTTGEVSRAASIAIWLKDGSLSTGERLIGAGAGAARGSATTGRGFIAKRYAPLAISSTAAAALLWEVGVIGFVLFAVLLAAAVPTAARVARTAGLSAEERATAEALGAFFLIALTLLIYNVTLLDDPPIQLLLAGAVGLLGVLCKQAVAAARAREEEREDEVAAGDTQISTFQPA
jgi:hypothetical protein